MNEVARAAMIAARSISACRTVMGTPFAGTACHQGSAPVSLRKARIHHLCYEYYAKKEAGVDTEKCTVLLTAIDQGSLSGAAEALGYTPSGVSRLVASLEAELGLPLLVRGKGGVTPTPECEALRPRFAEPSLPGTGLPRRGRRRARPGGRHAHRGQRLPTALPRPSLHHCRLQRRAPPASRCASSTRTAPPWRAGMAQRAIDFSLMSRREIDCRWTPLSHDAMVAVLPARPPAGQSRRLPHRASARPSRSSSCTPGEDCDNSRTLATAGIRPRAAYAVHDTSAAFALVEAGLGIALMNDIYARTAEAEVAVVPLAPARIVEIGIAAPPGRPSPALAAFEAFAVPRLQREAR